MGAEKSFVLRYLGEDDTGENITKEEADRLHAVGLKIALVYQVGKGWMLEGGFARGVQAAEVACEQSIAVGMPGNRPVYFSLDVDPNVLTEPQWDVVNDCVDGIQSVIGWGQVGIYGGKLALDRLVPSRASWGWQTASWSKGLWSPMANIHQYRHNIPFCGGTVDFNRSITHDFGQW